MAWLIQTIGALLVLLALVDVFLTVLYARSGVGLITPRVNRVIWQSMLKLAPTRSPARDTFLSYGGPLLLVLTVAVWAFLLFLGSALIAWPELGSGIRAIIGTTPTDFVTALYYGGYSLTTLGTGDLVPHSGWLKILMVLQALVGFSFVTLTITYFMSVYGALLRRNKLAQSLHHISGETGDRAEILVRLGPGGDFRDGSGHLSQIGRDLIDVLESHHLYPVLHYFRMTEPRYAMARVALIALDTASLARCSLGTRHRDFADSAAVQLLWGSRLNFVRNTAKTFVGGKAEKEPAVKSEPGSDDEREARGLYREALAKLGERGIETAEDPAVCEQDFVELRRKWIGLVRAFAEAAGHRWEDVSPAQARSEPSTGPRAGRRPG